VRTRFLNGLNWDLSLFVIVLLTSSTDLPLYLRRSLLSEEKAPPNVPPTTAPVATSPADGNLRSFHPVSRYSPRTPVPIPPATPLCIVSDLPNIRFAILLDSDSYV